MRAAVLDRDDWLCRHCGAGHRQLEAHHVRPLDQGGEPYDLDNIRTLCAECHAELTAKAARAKTADKVAGRREWLERLGAI